MALPKWLHHYPELSAKVVRRISEPVNPSTASDWRTSMRARHPEAEGYVERDGVRIFYEAFGTGEPTILLLPTWSVLHAAHGRFQIADLARHYRVVTFDGRGNGRSDRPKGAAAYDDRQFVADALGVLDATGTERAVVIACSTATHWLLRLAAEHPDRVLAAVASGTNLPLAPGHPRPVDMVPFHEHYRSTDGWAKFNADYWREHYEDFLRFFFSQVWTEPHSRKVIEDCVAWGLETTPDTLIDTIGPGIKEAEAIELARRVSCPMLVIHGGNDAVTPLERGARLARETSARLVILDGAGHCSGNRDPVKFNLLVREFVESILSRRPKVTNWTRALTRQQRVLFVPSGAGLRTALRDMAIADGLRALRSGLQIEWLAAAPIRQLLEEHGEAIHPASEELMSEAAHPTQEDGAHRLPPSFEAYRRLDEILFVNFMVFNDVVAQEPIDLVIADGAWQIDHYLHGNPELKRFAYAWLTDTVGWLTVPEGGERGALLTADANAEMLAQVERYPRVRDRAIYVGDPADLPAGTFGSGLPAIRDWTREHFILSGPITGFETPEATRTVASTLADLL